MKKRKRRPVRSPETAQRPVRTTERVDEPPELERARKNQGSERGRVAIDEAPKRKPLPEDELKPS